MSPLIGYSMVIYKQIRIITALNGLRRGCVYVHACTNITVNKEETMNLRGSWGALPLFGERKGWK